MEAAQVAASFYISTWRRLDAELRRQLDAYLAMRHPALIFILPLALAGCSVITERSSLGYGDYVALSCDQLGEEAVRLLREIGDRSEHLLESNEQKREDARRSLKLVKQASAAKGCNA